MKTIQITIDDALLERVDCVFNGFDREIGKSTRLNNSQRSLWRIPGWG